MGAKGPSKLKLRRPTYKCNACSKKFLSTQALKTHQYCVHKLRRNSKRSLNETTKLPAVPETAVKDKENSSSTTKPDKKPEGKIEMPVNEEQQTSLIAFKSLDDPNSRKTNFSCSKCKQLFSTYFSARKHIEKYHESNTKGQKENADSEAIRPECVESCLKCYHRVEVDKPHTCPKHVVIDLAACRLYVCMGCNNAFESIKDFDSHVTGLHGDGVLSLFFPTKMLFNEWKEYMEKETLVKYSALSKNNQRQTYRCMFLPRKQKDTSSMYFCPSSIMIREYSRGLQVFFHQQHHGHPFIEYQTPNHFRQYTVNDKMLKPPVDFDPYDIGDNGEENDMYIQFKKLMNCIVVDSAKLNIGMLKVLISKAFEMTAILNAYDEETGTIPKLNLEKSMTDKEIFRALKLFMTTNEYKPTVGAEDEPQDKLENSSKSVPKILNTFSLAGTNSQVQTEAINTTPKILNTRTLRKSVRFKDSPTEPMRFKDSPTESMRFKDSPNKVAVPTPVRNATPRSVPTVISSKTVLTSASPTPMLSIGPSIEAKFIESPSLTIASTTLATSTPIGPPTKTSKKTEPGPSKSVKKALPLSELVSFNDSYKDFVDKNFKVNTDVKKTDSSAQKEKSAVVKNTDSSVQKEKSSVVKNTDCSVHIEKSALSLRVFSKPQVDHNKNNKLTDDRPKAPERAPLNKKPIVDFEKVIGPQGQHSKTIRKALMRKLKKRPGNKRKMKLDLQKKLVKTKIGQYKPIVSPQKVTKDRKELSSRKAVSKFKSAKTKVDLNYEVKEQDNDCNILILKI